MEESRWEAEFYTKRNGRCPIQEFLDRIPSSDWPYIRFKLELLQEHGPNLDRPHAAYLRDGIWELRPRVKKVRYRLFYFFHNTRQIIITHGIKKKTKKVPPSEIDKAVRYRADYLQRG